MLHTQYVFVYGDTCILIINFAPPKVKSWLRHWVVVVVVVADGGGGCDWLLKFAVQVFIIILISFLYYFNQIVKNIDSLPWGVKSVRSVV